MNIKVVSTAAAWGLVVLGFGGALVAQPADGTVQSAPTAASVPYVAPPGFPPPAFTPTLGVTGTWVSFPTPWGPQMGLRVTTTTNPSLARLDNGDIIVRVNNIRVNNQFELSQALQQVAAMGGGVNVKVRNARYGLEAGAPEYTFVMGRLSHLAFGPPTDWPLGSAWAGGVVTTYTQQGTTVYPPGMSGPSAPSSPSAP